MITQSPRRKVVWQIPPRTPRLGHIHDRVENFAPFIAWWSPQPLARRKKLTNNFPFSIADIALISFSVLHPKRCSRNALPCTDIYHTPHQTLTNNSRLFL